MRVNLSNSSLQNRYFSGTGRSHSDVRYERASVEFQRSYDRLGSTGNHSGKSGDRAYIYRV